MEIIPFNRVSKEQIEFSGENISSGEVNLIVRGQIIHSAYFAKSKATRYYMGHPLLKGVDNEDIEVRQNVFGNKLDTNLFYIHITKTGGTSIEQAGYEYGVKWGRWAYKEYHEPSNIFMGLKIIKNKTLFTSVRNPYARIASDAYCPFRLINEPPPKTKDEFNKIINSYIHTEYPCYDFVYHKGKQVIPHVIKMEDGLTEQFNKLMAEQNCVVRMEIHTNKGIGKKYGVDDIDPANIELINNKFEKDFEHFGYTMK